MDNIAYHSMLRCLKWMNKSLAHWEYISYIETYILTCLLARLLIFTYTFLLTFSTVPLRTKDYVHPVCSFAEGLSLIASLTGFRCDPRRIGH